MEKNESLPIGTILDSGVRKYEIKSVLGKGGVFLEASIYFFLISTTPISFQAIPASS